MACESTTVGRSLLLSDVIQNLIDSLSVPAAGHGLDIKISKEGTFPRARFSPNILILAHKLLHVNLGITFFATFVSLWRCGRAEPLP